MPARYRTLLLLSAVLAAYALARTAGLPSTPGDLAVPAYIRLHGIPWRRML